VTADRVRAFHTAGAALILGAVAVVLVAFSVAVLGRTLRVGTYEAFHKGLARAAGENPEFLARVMVWGPYCVLGAAVLLATNRMHGRRVL